MRIFFALWALPLLAQQPANTYDVEKERALGQRLAAEMQQRAKPVNNPAIEAYVSRIGSELVVKLGQTPFEYQFRVVSDGGGTEPAPFPGGYVVVPLRSLLDARDEAEFAGMLAHSLGHVALRHSIRTVTRAQVPNYASVPLIFVGGTSGCHVSAQAPLAVPLGMLNQFRDAELEADQLGLELANRTGFDAAGFVRYIERSQPEDTPRSPLPAREQRLSRLHETQSSLPPAPARLPSDEFLQVRELARQFSAQVSRRVPTLNR